MPRRLTSLIVILSLAPLAGCAGLGDFAWHTANPVGRPYAVKNNDENVLLAHGKPVPPADLKQQPGQPWPTSYPTDPTIMDIERAGSGVP